MKVSVFVPLVVLTSCPALSNLNARASAAVPPMVFDDARRIAHVAREPPGSGSVRPDEISRDHIPRRRRAGNRHARPHALRHPADDVPLSRFAAHDVVRRRDLDAAPTIAPLRDAIGIEADPTLLDLVPPAARA